MIATNGNEFKAIVKGKNFMTPTILGYYITGNYTVELSKGTGFHGETIYGVTVADTEANEAKNELSRCVDTRKNAMQYIKNLGSL